MSKHVHAELIEKLRAIAGDLASQPHEKCWQVMEVQRGNWIDVQPSTAVIRLNDVAWKVRRKPKSSRERFEEWARENEFNTSKSHHVYCFEKTALAWKVWEVAERQALAGGE